MKKKSRSSLFSPDTIFFVRWGDKHYLMPRKEGGNSGTKYTSKKGEGYEELVRITDYHIPIMP